MKKIFIDTNVWLRFLVADKKEKYEACKKLIGLNEEGKFRSYTSTIVMLELVYTLSSFYKVSKREIASDIKGILSSRNLTLLEKTDFQKTLLFYQRYNIKLADFLIAAQLPKGLVLCSYDQDFKKIKDVISVTPEEIVAGLKIDD